MKIKTILLWLTLLVLASCTSRTEPIPVLAPEIAVTPASADWWRPEPGLTWQWQLTGLPIVTTIEADVYDIDLFESDAGTVEELQDKGRKVICYLSAGSWEDWRPDADKFPEEVIGKDYEGWQGEKWLDIRRIDLLAPIMRERLDLCKAKGFDGVEPDNIDIHLNDTGFPLTYADQFAYAKWLADEAHARGLAIGIKNAPEIIIDALACFDFAITEDAFYQGWAEETLPLIKADKAVFAAEYTDTGADFQLACQWAKANGVSIIQKDRDLTSFRAVCP